jgi:hypothetical protein
MRKHVGFLRLSSAVLGFAIAGILMLALPGGTSTARADGKDWHDSVFKEQERWGRPSRLGVGAGRETRTARRGRGGVRVASLGSYAPPSPGPSLSGGVKWAAPAGCINGTLRSAIAAVASFGAVTVSSTCRNHAHNRRVGGARKSHHLTGNAADFRVRGNVRGALAMLRSFGSLGGIKHYGGGLIHIDTGPKRSW